MITHSHTLPQGNLVSVAAISGQFYCASTRGLLDSLFNCPIYQTAEISTKIMSVASETERDLVVLELDTKKNEISVKLFNRAAWLLVWEDPSVFATYERAQKSAAHIDVFQSKLVTVDPQQKLLITLDFYNDHKENYALNGMKQPYGVHMLSEDLILLSDHQGHTVSKLTLYPGGHYDVVWTCEDIVQPSGICRDVHGRIYVASYTKNMVYILSPNGELNELG